MPPFLDELQTRMAEVLFSPGAVLARAWRDGRPTQRRYRSAAFVLVVVTLGFGALLGRSLSDPATFSLDSPPSLSLSFGSWFLVIWALFAGYVLIVAVSIEVISWMRR